MTEREVHSALSLGVIGVGAVVLVVLFRITAPYGRHARSGWGPEVPARLGWVLMESPAVLVFGAVYLRGRNASHLVPASFCLLWLTHYVYRALVYPLRLPTARKPMPLSVCAMAVVFNGVNAYLNARWLSELGPYPSSWLLDPRCWAGVGAFVAGFTVNVLSDDILLGLRKPGERGYRIPHGGAFRWVSSPNYLGELIEWAGWATATWSLSGLAFFCFAFANLVPRAIAHHRWYLSTFADYPKDRRAIIPWLW